MLAYSQEVNISFCIHNDFKTSHTKVYDSVGQKKMKKGVQEMNEKEHTSLYRSLNIKTKYRPIIIIMSLLRTIDIHKVFVTIIL